MNKEPKTLPQAIKIIVGIYGKNVVNDVQMVNIMNDVVALEDSNAVKTILRDCIKSGYGGKILLLSPKDDYRIKIQSFSKQLSDSHGYKEVIVQYILYSIAFGIGVCPNEPYLKNINTPKSPPKAIKRTKTEGQIVKIEESGLQWGKIGIVAVLLISIVLGVNYWTFSSQREEF